MALHHLWNDVRFALRQFARRRGLTLAALFALACGLGGVTTVFTLVDAVILRPLPVASPGQLVCLRDPSFSFPVFQEVSARGGMLSHVFAWDSRRLQAQWTSEPESTQVLLATGGIHETLGLRPAAGRLLTPSDSGQSAADAQAVAVLSYSAWQRRFGTEPSAIGQTLRIEGTPFTIVGVTPPGFSGVAVGMPVDVTIPLTMLPRLREDERQALTSPGNSWVHIMGRLRPGVSLAAADAAFQTIWPQILRATAIGVDPGFRPRYLTFTSGLEPGASGFSPVRRQFRDALWLLFGLVGLLLVAACATVANLLLAAAAGRRHELALRVALGAGRRQIVQQLFVEGLLLAVAGGVLGLLFSTWATDLLVGLLSTSYESVVVNVTPDRRVFAFIALVVGVSTVVFTIAPIARASRLEPACMLDGGTRQTGSRHRARGARLLVAVQVAISLTLLAGSALFVRNLSQLLETDIGFERENLLVVGVDVMSPLSEPGRRATGAPDLMLYYAELLRRLRETPGVRSASLSYKAPISNEQGSWWDTFAADGGVPRPPAPPCAPISMPPRPATSPRRARRSSRGGTSNGATGRAPRGSSSSTRRLPAPTSGTSRRSDGISSWAEKPRGWRWWEWRAIPCIRMCGKTGGASRICPTCRCPSSCATGISSRKCASQGRRRWPSRFERRCGWSTPRCRSRFRASATGSTNRSSASV